MIHIAVFVAGFYAGGFILHWIITARGEPLEGLTPTVVLIASLTWPPDAASFLPGGTRGRTKDATT